MLLVLAVDFTFVHNGSQEYVISCPLITNGNIFKKGAGPIENYYKNQLEEMTKIEVRHIMFMAKRCSVL